MGQEALLEAVVAVGEVKWPGEFHVSMRTLVRHKPYWVKVAGRDVCLCYQHEAEKFRCVAHAQWLKTAHSRMRANNQAVCGCTSFTSVHDCHHHFMCAKEKWGPVDCYQPQCIK